MRLSELIRKNQKDIYETMHIGYANWDKLIESIAQSEELEPSDFADEQVWTFLLCCAYAVAKEHGAQRLASQVIERQPTSPSKIWFEVLPKPPRQQEGSTHVDFAMGSIGLRQGTQSGIELSEDRRSWVSFVECKWYSDISGTVSRDLHRNQLARVIENAIYFNKNKQRFADDIHVTLITPAVFKQQTIKSRLYHYKYESYSSDDFRDLNMDLDASCLPLAEPFPDRQDRLKLLKLHWLSYEELFTNAPESELKIPLMEFLRKHNGSKPDAPVC